MRIIASDCWDLQLNVRLFLLKTTPQTFSLDIDQEILNFKKQENFLLGLLKGEIKLKIPNTYTTNLSLSLSLSLTGTN